MIIHGRFKYVLIGIYLLFTIFGVDFGMQTQMTIDQVYLGSSMGYWFFWSLVIIGAILYFTINHYDGKRTEYKKKIDRELIRIFSINNISRSTYGEVGDLAKTWKLPKILRDHLKSVSVNMRKVIESLVPMMENQQKIDLQFSDVRNTRGLEVTQMQKYMEAKLYDLAEMSRSRIKGYNTLIEYLEVIVSNIKKNIDEQVALLKNYNLLLFQSVSQAKAILAGVGKETSISSLANTARELNKKLMLVMQATTQVIQDDIEMEAIVTVSDQVDSDSSVESLQTFLQEEIKREIA